MPGTPNPLPALDGSRRLFCRHYSACLDQAALLDWPGFSCRACQAYVLAALDLEEALEMADACRLLLERVFAEEPPRVSFNFIGGELAFECALGINSQGMGRGTD